MVALAAGCGSARRTVFASTRVAREDLAPARTVAIDRSVRRRAITVHLLGRDVCRKILLVGCIDGNECYPAAGKASQFSR
jgi:hypothetical protein